MKIRLLTIMLSLFLLCFVSCDNEKEDVLNPEEDSQEQPDNEPDPDIIFDIFPIELGISVTDKQGQNLLEPETEGNILNSKMYIIVNEKEYEVGMERPEQPYWPDPFTRSLPAEWYGAFIAPTFWTTDSEDPDFSFNRLWIGEFDGLDDEDKVELYLDGHQFEITITNKMIDWSNFHIDRHIYLNGEEVGSRYFKIVL